MTARCTVCGKCWKVSILKLGKELKNYKCPPCYYHERDVKRAEKNKRRDCK